MRRIDVKLLNTTKSTLKRLTVNVGDALGVAKKKKKIPARISSLPISSPGCVIDSQRAKSS